MGWWEFSNLPAMVHASCLQTQKTMSPSVFGHRAAVLSVRPPSLVAVSFADRPSRTHCFSRTSRLRVYLRIPSLRLSGIATLDDMSSAQGSVSLVQHTLL